MIVKLKIKLKRIIKLLFRFVPIDKKLIVMIHNGNSGSNLNPIINSNAFKQFKSLIIGGNYNRNTFLNKMKSIFFINRAKLIMTTHGPLQKPKKNQVSFDLWHGFPLKGMHYMDHNDYRKKDKFNATYILSTSNLFNTFLNACIAENISKYKVLGYPRNDYLFKSDGINNLNHLIENSTKFNKIILFMPTWRRSNLDIEEERKRANIFLFSDFESRDFNKFLIENNYLFVMKFHPNEEKIMIDQFSKEIKSNMTIITNELLSDKNKDFYEIVNSSDILITDYSSICFDYLLINKPIIFINSDIDSYKEERGLLVEVYDDWTPGFKVDNSKDLSKAIKKALNEDPHVLDRQKLLNKIHRYQDSNSTDRVIEFIKKIIW